MQRVDPSSLQVPAPGERAIARLVQLSDPHLLKNARERHRSVNTAELFEQVLDRAQTLIRRADAVLLTGDVAQDELAETYARLRDGWTERWMGSETPVWCLPGNHDAPVFMATELSKTPFSYLGHHTLANWEVILLDSRRSGAAAGQLGEQELARLASRLEQSTADHLLLALHHPPLTLGNSWLDAVGLEDRAALFAQVDADARVRAIVFGHIHHVVDRFRGAVRLLGCPSTGVQFTPYQREFSLDQRPPGLRTFDLYASGAVRTQVLWLAPNATDPSSDVAALA